MNQDQARSLREQVEAFFGGGRCFLFAKGRVGLYAGLRALDLPAGAKVLMPGYTCMVVPSAVKHAGFAPLYVDIDPDTYNLDPRRMEAVAPEEVAAIVVQHTYGIPCDVAAVRAWMGPRQIPLIEDCCHTFGTPVRGQRCGTFGEFAFMSGQWNKPFSTGLGGILLVNNPSLAEKIGSLADEETCRVGWLKNLMLRAQILVFEALYTPRTAAVVTGCYRALNRLGLVIGSSSREELKASMPNGYLCDMAPCQVRKGLREMARLEENLGHRRRLTALYHERLVDSPLAALAPGLAEVPLLRYPVRVANKDEVLDLARRRGIEIGSWFEVPLHPAGTPMEKLDYRAGMCPEGERASREVVNLPTHLKTSRATAEKTFEFLLKHGKPA